MLLKIFYKQGFEAYKLFRAQLQCWKYKKQTTVWSTEGCTGTHWKIIFTYLLLGTKQWTVFCAAFNWDGIFLLLDSGKASFLSLNLQFRHTDLLLLPFILPSKMTATSFLCFCALPCLSP